jgi:hypothetical protein
MQVLRTMARERCARSFALRSGTEKTRIAAGHHTITRSGLKSIRGPAGIHVSAVQGGRSAVDRVSKSDNQRRNAEKWAGSGLRPEIGVSRVTAPGNGTTIPGARRLANIDFRARQGREYF